MLIKRKQAIDDRRWEPADPHRPPPGNTPAGKKETTPKPAGPAGKPILTFGIRLASLGATFARSPSLASEGDEEKLAAWLEFH